MQVANPETSPNVAALPHRAGGISFVSLLRGEPGAKDNFELTLVHTTDEFQTPRHRHNFDQVRVMLEGEFGYDTDRVQPQDTIGYFSEGTYYKQQGIGQSLTLLLQLGGATGSGYMSFQQLKDTTAALGEKGEFNDGIYTYYDEAGKKHNADGYEAAWEALFGKKLTYPKPRYQQPVVLTPDHFTWLPMDGSDGRVQQRELGRFHERGLEIAQFRLASGGQLALPASKGIQLVFVYDGDGTIGDQAVSRRFAVQLDPGEAASAEADSEMTLLRLRLPVF